MPGMRQRKLFQQSGLSAGILRRRLESGEKAVPQPGKTKDPDVRGNIGRSLAGGDAGRVAGTKPAHFLRADARHALRPALRHEPALL